MSRSIPETDSIYHIYNRGVEKREIFTNDSEHSYFIHLLYTLNNGSRSFNTKRIFQKTSIDRGRTSINIAEDRLVEIFAFVLMPNHFHLLLQQKVDGGVSKFMQKLGTGYTMMFNAAHKRSGVLFQGKYKHVQIDTDHQLLYVPHYIHLNPLPLIQEKNISPQEKLTFLETYKWSSCPDHIGKKSFPSVTNRDTILELFGGVPKYRKDLLQTLSENYVGKYNDVEETVLIDRDVETTKSA